MNSRFALLALSIAIAVLSLALFITVVGATASSVGGVTIGIEPDAVIRGGTHNRLLAYQRPNISPDETLSLTEPISIYLPMLATIGYIDKSAERAALMALYNSTNGDDWINNSGWGTDSPHCDWYGVTCDENEHVTILDLDRNRLSGTIPSAIGNLPMLTILRLTGTIECNKGGCEYYQLSGPLPPEIGKLVNLLTLDLRYNQLTTLPAEIGNLTSLHVLDLWVNQLTSLPPEIGGLVNLESLDLAANQLSSLPAAIGNLASLQGLELCDNRLESLPPEIGNLASLQSLVLCSNQLTSLPPEIGNLVNLQVLELSGNQLISIQAEIGNLVNLWDLWMGSNRLSGPIPAMLRNLVNLKELELYGNPDLTCWETKEARDWALSLSYYVGPTCVSSK